MIRLSKRSFQDLRGVFLDTEGHRPPPCPNISPKNPKRTDSNLFKPNRNELSQVRLVAVKENHGSA